MADAGSPTAAPPERYQLFEAGWRRCECSLRQLWVQYLGVGGTLDLFSLDAFLHGVMPLPPDQQDILANAINEELEDIFEAAKVPYLHPLHAAQPGAPARDALSILDDIFRGTPAEGTDPA